MEPTKKVIQFNVNENVLWASAILGYFVYKAFVNRNMNK